MRRFYHSRILIVCSCVVFLLIGFMSVNTTHIWAKENSIQPLLSVKVVLQRKYLDGEISEEIIQENVSSMEDIWELYTGWQLLDQMVMLP